MSPTPTANRYGSAVVELPSETDIRVTRAFDAAAESVFAALTTPELVKRWWGSEKMSWKVCDIDLRAGGTWRFVVRYRLLKIAFHGAYTEVDAPRRLVQTEAIEGAPEAATGLTTIELDEADGVTTMTVLSQYRSREIRDRMIGQGNNDGLQTSYNRLEDVLRAG
ncbi:ATPase [Skermania sp. ID1734]|uniref:SRPBCC domain-containing protein n=1 Tax=Skermania sp. ID1734 TaxID=2597516 RepID=UPI00117C1D43|nr:SRPBCC domain-containing protein [Skermania sp. ID1734]TSE00727.1 ATPase [Skermania sp. ID1734]